MEDCQNTLDRLVATRFQFKTESAAHEIAPVTFDRMVSPFYEGVRWAVRHMGSVLAKYGEWEYEPLPSSRGDDFYTRCRFETLESAVAAYDKMCLSPNLTMTPRNQGNQK